MVRRAVKAISGTAGVMCEMYALKNGEWFEWKDARCFYVGAADAEGGRLGKHAIRVSRNGEIELHEVKGDEPVQHLPTCTGWSWKKSDDTVSQFWLLREEGGLWYPVWANLVDILTYANKQPNGKVEWKTLKDTQANRLAAPEEGE